MVGFDITFFGYVCFLVGWELALGWLWVCFKWAGVQ